MRVLLIGLGRWGAKHLKVLLDLGHEVWGVDTDPQRREWARSTYGLPADRVSGRYDAFLEMVSAVDVVTPAQTQYALSREALARGKDVFAEKPMASTLEEAKGLVDLSTRASRVFQVGYLQRFNPAVLAFRSLIVSERLGEIRYLRGHFLGFKRPRTDVGVTQTDGIHFFDLFNFLLGRQPDGVSAVVRDFLGRGLDDLSLVTLDYGTAVAHVESGYLPPGKWRDLIFVGAEGSAVLDLDLQTLSVHWNRHRKVGGKWTAEEGGVQEIPIARAEPLRCELEAFFRAVDRREPSPVDALAGYEALRIVEGAHISAREGRHVLMKDVIP